MALCGSNAACICNVECDGVADTVDEYHKVHIH